MSDPAARLMRALRFWTRLPWPVLPFETDPHASPVMERLALAAPVVGVIVGLFGVVTLLLLLVLCGIAGFPAAVLAIGVMVLVTGAMHEDGLADVADGFGGGASAEAKLNIMQDSSVGTYGALALILAVVLKAGLLAQLVAAEGPWRGAGALLAATALSRISGLWPLVVLPPARESGMGASAGSLSMEAWRSGAYLGAGIAFGLAFLSVGLWGALLALLCAAAVSWGLARLAEWQIGGQTGDVCGAATILGEIAVLFALAIDAG